MLTMYDYVNIEKNWHSKSDKYRNSVIQYFRTGEVCTQLCST